jgi:hypothetical protein
MSTPPAEIGELLQKRRQRVRSWVRPDAHPLVAGQVHEACAALGAMAGMLGETAPALSRLLIESNGERLSAAAQHLPSASA